MNDGKIPGVAADPSTAVFPGSGELARLCRVLDWSATSLGPVSGWPVSLRTAVGIVLASPFPMIVLWGPDLVQIYNDGYRGLMGTKHPRGLGQPTRDCWPEAWEFNAPIYEAVLERGDSVSFENRPFRLCRAGAAEEAWFTAAYSPIPADDGRVGGVLVAVFETTEQVRARAAERDRQDAERALGESEERFRALVSDTSFAVYRMSPDWSELRQLDGRGFVSDHASPTRGWLEEYIEPEDRAGLLEAIAAAIRAKAPFEQEHRVRRLDGTVGWAHSRAVPLLDANGEIREWFGAAGEITARKEGEQRLQRIANVEGVGVLHFDIASGVLVDANDAFLRMLGYDGADLRSRSLTWRRLTPPEYVAESERQLRVLEVTGRIGPYEKEYLRKDGSRTWMLFAGAALGDGTLIEYCIDVNDRKRAEAALVEAKEAAERANQVKTQFLSTLSHELRTPLTAVIGLADLIANEVVGPTTPKQREYLARIDVSAWHLVSIIDEILTFSRTEAGKERTRIARCDVAEIVRSVVALLTDHAHSRGLALTLRGANEPVVVHTDGGKVRQILVNLVGNAIQYTDSGSVHVSLEAQDGIIELCVRDTGPGIPQERQEEVFEPFVQLDGGTTREHGGTGLGLTICRRLARMLGGDVTLESAPGAGSSFTVRLPRSAAKETLLVE